MLEAKGLNFAYGKTPILKDVHFTAKEGQVISLIGPNGSGKSTLLRCLSGILSVQGQSVYLQGKAIETMNSKEISRNIAFLPQFHAKMQGITVKELIAMGRTPYHKSGWILTREDKEKIQWASDYMQLAHLNNRLVEKLSGGEKQRVWIAMILAQDTPIVLLDEPVTYMDLKYQRELLKTINELRGKFNKTVITVFHDINHAIEISDVVYLLKGGHVYRAGHTDQVITESAIHEVYGVHTHICKFSKCCRNVVIPATVHEQHRACTGQSNCMKKTGDEI